jgi:glucokinase
MNTIRTITAVEMKGINRTAILELIRRSGVTSRIAIAKTLKVSMPTVMRIVDELICEKFVQDVGEKEWSGGRKRSLIKLNTSEHLTIGLDLGGTKFYGAVTDLGGRILFERKLSKHSSKGEESYHLAASLITELLEMAQGTGKSIMGIGVGAPGVTFHDKGIIEWAPSLEWSYFPLKERLQSQFHLPVIVDNDVNLSALGEIWFGVGSDKSNLVFINIGTGIGAGVVIDGALYRGAREMAGEIGYLIPGREYLNHQYPGFGALELLAAGTGIACRAGNVMRQMKNGSPDEITAEEVFDACRKKEDWAVEIINETLDYLAITVAAVITFFDPEVIVLSGGVVQSTDLVIEPLLQRLKGKIPHIPPVVASTLGHRAAVLGAMINLLHNTSDFYVVHKLS